MKKILLFAAAVLAALASCSPSAYVLDLEMRYPSTSGDDFTGKEMAVVCIEKADRSDSAAVLKKAAEIAAVLENDYYGGDTVIPFYSITRDPEANYSAVDTLVAYVMETGADVVFVIDGDWAHYYDAFGDGKVRTQPSFRPRQFASNWKRESYTVLYYETDTWLKALNYATQMKWQQASDEWVYLAEKSKNNMQMRSCAEYDVALACYMVGNYDLALKWLDASDADYPISLSKGLRSRINKKKQL